ncbi:helix-turn-helix domain-containing protein [Providencia rettgeri]|uniref:helix-turn-helix domain-containing protein n=1 Tax=Providencia rettgeri TaxID=587 RepID=UPI0032ED6FD6
MIFITTPSHYALVHSDPGACIDSPCISPKRLNVATGKFIRNKRVNRGFSGKALGVQLKISQQHVSRYERGVTSINLHQLNQILSILSVSWECFIQDVIIPLSQQNEAELVKDVSSVFR